MELVGRIVRESGCEEPLDWRSVLVVNSMTRPRMMGKRPQLLSTGCNFLVLNKQGQPCWFGKCRVRNDPELARETRVIRKLRSDVRLAKLIPVTASGNSERLAILTSQFIPGVTLKDEIGQLRPRLLRRAVADCLQAGYELSVRGQAIADLRVPEGSRIDLREEAAEPLRYLERLGTHRRVVEVLRDHMVSPGLIMPSAIQHGDLWPGNVIRKDRELWLVDFELFGLVHVPFYDTLHFVRACIDLAIPPRGRQLSWLERITSDDPKVAVLREELALALERQEASQISLMGALTYYVVNFFVSLHRRGAPRSFWDPYLQDVNTLAEMLHARRSIVDVLLGQC